MCRRRYRTWHTCDQGIDLRINKLDIDSSELGIEGDIISLEYSDKEGRETGAEVSLPGYSDDSFN